MRVKFVKPHGVYRPGDVIDAGGGVGNMLCLRGVAVPEPQQPLLEAAVVDREARTADVRPKRRRRRQ